MNRREPANPPTLVGAEPLATVVVANLDHLAANRSLIIRRSLLATALGAAIPIPLLDDMASGRVRAGLLMKIAEARQVDLPAASAQVLAGGRAGSVLRNATTTAATVLAFRLTLRKVFALVSAGRGADEMATTFQIATLFDHYCAQLHVGAALDTSRATLLREQMHGTILRTEKDQFIAAFAEGGRILARSILEAPRWMSSRVLQLAQRWVATGGNPAVTFDHATDRLGVDTETDQWLDKGARTVEGRLSGGLGRQYLVKLVDEFERRLVSGVKDPPGATPGRD